MVHNGSTSGCPFLPDLRTSGYWTEFGNCGFWLLVVGFGCFGFRVSSCRVWAQLLSLGFCVELRIHILQKTNVEPAERHSIENRPLQGASAQVPSFFRSVGLGAWA